MNINHKQIKRMESSFVDNILSILSELTEPLFVKIGANDGISDDPCGEHFLNFPQWKGILVEPVPYCLQKLKSIYSDKQRFTIIPNAISDTPGVASFYYLDENALQHLPMLPSWYDKIGSFQRHHIFKHFDYDVGPFICEMQVEVETLSCLLKRHNIQDIALLHIDAEGHDFNILKSLDWLQFCPKVILVEYKHLSPCDLESMIGTLWDKGYHIWKSDDDLLAAQ